MHSTFFFAEYEPNASQALFLKSRYHLRIVQTLGLKYRYAFGIIFWLGEVLVFGYFLVLVHLESSVIG